MNHKHYLSQRIREQTDEYLARGGRVRNVEPGASGDSSPDPQRLHQRTLTARASATRTPVPEVVAAIEARKQARRQAARTGSARRTRQPRRRMIYDDFGEPLRWEWTND